MANNYLLFSEIIPNLTAEEEAWLRSQLQLIAVRNGEEVEINDCGDEATADAEWLGARFLRDYEDFDPSWGEVGFEWGFGEEDAPSDWGRHLWVCAEENGEPANAAWLVRKFLKRFRPDQFWSLTWATTCSKPRVGEFGGGAFFVTADHIESQNAYEFLDDRERSFERRKKAAHVVEKATKVGIEPCDLFDLVRDEADRSAAAINNDGLGAQILYLVEQLGVEEAERQIEQAVVTRLTEAEGRTTT